METNRWYGLQEASKIAGCTDRTLRKRIIAWKEGKTPDEIAKFVRKEGQSHKLAIKGELLALIGNARKTQESRTEVGKEIEVPDGKPDGSATVIGVLSAQVETLKEQIKVKDRQIESLSREKQEIHVLLLNEQQRTLPAGRPENTEVELQHRGGKPHFKTHALLVVIGVVVVGLLVALVVLSAVR